MARPITVGSLIKQLQKYPLDHKIYFYRPPFKTKFRPVGWKTGKDNPWLYTSRGLYVPMAEMSAKKSMPSRWRVPKYKKDMKRADQIEITDTNNNNSD